MKLKKIAAVLLAGMPLGTMQDVETVLTAQARDSGSYCGDSLDWSLTDDGVLTVSGTGEMYDYYDMISPPWNDYLLDVKAVVIEEGVTGIGAFAFNYFPYLTSVTIPSSVTRIGGCAFADTPWMKQKQAEDPLVIVNGILIDATTVEGDCVIPETVERISDLSFTLNDKLTSVVLPYGLEEIEYGTFNGCTKLEDVSIPNCVTSIGKGAFCGCTSLTVVTLPNSVEYIGEWAFMGCKELHSVIVMNPECRIFDSVETFANDSYGDIGPFEGTIYGYAGSTAEAYAQKYGINFTALSETRYTLTGDVNGDDDVNASDAACILMASAAEGSTGSLPLEEWQKTAADVNRSGEINASDAALILMYSAARGAGFLGLMEDFLT